jgi:sulfide dehydrogenase [flavocytochrome c] flavoprotein subunit
MMLMKRRDFLKVGAAAGAMASLYGCAGGGKASGHVVVVGGGYGGATIAKYLRMWSEGGVQVTLIERNPTSFPARSPTWSLAAPRRWKTSRSATTA